MFKIGELAGIFDVSVRALRLYDRIGLLTPGYTDEKTGYRYYTPEQVEVLNTIIEFKSIGFNLKEIKDVMKNGMDTEAVIRLLNEKQSYWRDNVVIARHKINAINNMKRRICHSNKCRKKLKVVESSDNRAYRMSKLVCLEDSKVSSTLSEILWL